MPAAISSGGHVAPPLSRTRTFCPPYDCAQRGVSSKMISDSDESGSDVDFIAGGSSVQDIFNLRNERAIVGDR